ncbi:DEAD/DEAH box helicase [Ligilactobacillus saerimneri]|uniref:SNF2 family DNA/RNA helicase n=1 Tax=Ligilactobacillus saerimneri 30a TaxID=1227363 RepID=M5J7J8_9LACO|nr:DEAD/DEAH box helicase [Ligilactobacillus saerimneri]EKW98779.1 SNF2 family DNA/RNA helicase [Ligilactobacillus saerimneri 30a]
MATKSTSNPRIIQTAGESFQLCDDEKHTLETQIAQRALRIFASYFADENARIFKQDLTYVQLLNLVDKLNRRLARKDLPQVEMGQKFKQFIEQRKYFIKEQSQAGITIKADDPRWQAEFERFNEIVSAEVTRPLKPVQAKASFFLAVMKKAANFSVPGAGKTAMMYGAFAYLSSSQVREVNKLLVISPLNAFAAWRTEFTAVFGSKRTLNYMNMRDERYRNDDGAVKRDWANADVVTINYESLLSKLTVLNELIDSQTMLVFDEVHRIKGVGGKRAQAALGLSKAPYYRYVLTGTPIPNGFRDIYNFLHLMYPDEYSSFFAWDLATLNKIDAPEVNQKLAPFFWRTNKADLQVPKPDPDIIRQVKPTLLQQKLAQAIYETEKGTLATFIRLLQASTNPMLLRDNINYRELGLVDADSSDWNQNNTKIKQENASSGNNYRRFNLDQIRSPKFKMGIDLIRKLVAEGKKVLVWAMFVGTMQKITTTLQKIGINTTLIYGATPKEEREEMINNFRTGTAQVLVSNPNTLGESISLHQTVHDAVYFEYNFNLTFMLQSRDRINRLGLPHDQYTRYYYLMTTGDTAHMSFIDQAVYHRLKDKEQTMLEAIDGQMLVPEYTDDYLTEVKNIVLGRYK